MAGYDPYEQYWQGVPQRGNVKQPTGLAMLLNAVLGNAGQGYQQGMQQQGMAQEQQLRAQQMQTSQLQQQKLKNEMEWEPASRFMETTKAFGGEGITPSLEMRQLFAQKGIQLPEGGLSTMGEKRLEAMIQINENTVAEKDRYREDLKAKYAETNQRLVELNQIRQQDANTNRMKSEIARQAVELKGELAKTDNHLKLLKEQGIQLKMKAKDMLSVDKTVAGMMAKQQQGLPLGPGDQAAMDTAVRFRSAPAQIAAGAREQASVADQYKMIVQDMEKEIAAANESFRDNYGYLRKDGPRYKAEKKELEKEIRNIYNRKKVMYPFLKIEPPPGFLQENPFFQDLPITK